ncbi:hypothetical protein GLOTRDRAFT_79921 [Gloeophyllum trabeum ATCC 11539]|uniref:Nitrogen permease regulator 3 n=1 Tax=Gloeophyllum trabeum (strain ATCC 11539 / FP-39264 / Madison 617) TaxID=670483 RepID=S7PZN2_GLOTA|nr:uncharacterized protein GLOTRDRAFT_79921 [Gloeophyllum trabeum ATCC 11539]EPQ52757.1 hypothetical protein GLOTRDRAFT_79921 [Gloeophyllum trabeum ATCC 11539]
MAETLLALLLVTSSAKGSNLVYHWPEAPRSLPRLARPRPSVGATLLSQLDNPCRAIELGAPERRSRFSTARPSSTEDNDYEWKRPRSSRKRSTSFSRTGSVPASGRNSPVKEGGYDPETQASLALAEDYDDLFGYSAEFLAGILCPQRSLCHQKFELVVDDLAFIGHPVCTEDDGVWRFKAEQRTKLSSRGRDPKIKETSPVVDSPTNSPRVRPKQEVETSGENSWLRTFHFVIVLDLPDPSSSASGNVLKYFDIIYEQIAFAVTAVLFQQQVTVNFVERECDVLGSLKEEYIRKGEPYMKYMRAALDVSSIAPAMKTIYEAVKGSSIAQISIDNLSLELQLPPYLDKLLHSQEEADLDYIDRDEEEGEGAWGKDMSFAWRLPTLSPWKALLLLGEDDSGMDLYGNLRGPHQSSEERRLAQSLMRFLELASVRLQLADMAIELDWDLETQVYPVVRWLVYHRRAKVVDVVHEGLKTVFTISPSFKSPLTTLTQEFAQQFPPSIPSLPVILSLISGSTYQQTDNTFFAAVVRDKELVPAYHAVVEWMLKKELLVTMHLRIRVVATPALKKQVRELWLSRRKNAGQIIPGTGRRSMGGSGPVHVELDALAHASPPAAFLSMSPRSVRRRVLNSADLTGSALDSEDEGREEDDGACGEDMEFPEDYADFNDEEPSLIDDPGTARPIERCWLAAMGEGKDYTVRRRFEQINQYFDGKKTDDEILFRADISRKQLREVLHHYDEYLQTFLHPS